MQGLKCLDQVHKNFILTMGVILKTNQLGTKKKVLLINALYDQYQDGTLKNIVDSYYK